jgi:hypothetical protein
VPVRQPVRPSARPRVVKKQPSPVPFAIGIVLLLLWALWGLFCILFSWQGVTISYGHHVCSSGITQLLAPVGCSRLDQIYGLSTIVFWVGLVLTAQFLAREVLSRRAPQAPYRERPPG